MTLPSQNYPDNRFAIRRYGCRFMTLAGIAMMEVGENLTYPQIDELYEEACAVPLVIVNPDTAKCGPNENWIIDKTFMLLGHSHIRGIQVGDIRGRVSRLWNGKETGDYQYIIRHWKTKGADGHFTLMSRDGVEYDPHNPLYDKNNQGIEKLSLERELIYKVY